MSGGQVVELFDGGITSVPGFLASGVRAGIKRRGLDLMLICAEGGPVPAAGAFTTNRIKGAPLLITQEHIRDGKLAAVVANSGIANVFTGRRGLEDARRMAGLTAKLLGLKPRDVAVASTGLIGRFLPMRKVEYGIREAVKTLSGSREAGLRAAKAIMTTDTVPKEAAARVRLGDGSLVTIAGISKGSGMVNPRMRTATTLTFLVTDAAITPDALKRALGNAVDKSLNMLNIDNETSTSDMALILANGRAGNRTITSGHPDSLFQEALETVLIQLTRMLARDGEGATKLVEIQVSRAKTLEEAKRAAKTIAGSNLLKAAIFGHDPNWGRVVAALGYSGARVDPKRLKLEVESDRGRVVLVTGENPPGKGVLQRAREILLAREVKIHLDLGLGSGSAKTWTCDLTYDYVKINSRYST